MCHASAATNVTPNAEVLPFMRTASVASPDHEPPRRPSSSHAAVIEDVGEVRAMVGLLSLAAESLPAGHSTEFLAVLEPADARLTAILTRMRVEQRPAGEA